MRTAPSQTRWEDCSDQIGVEPADAKGEFRGFVLHKGSGGRERKQAGAKY